MEAATGNGNWILYSPFHAHPVTFFSESYKSAVCVSSVITIHEVDDNSLKVERDRAGRICMSWSHMFAYSLHKALLQLPQGRVVHGRVIEFWPVVSCIII